MATYSSILAWVIPWTEEPEGLYSSWSHKVSNTTEHTHTHRGQVPFRHFVLTLLFCSLVTVCFPFSRTSHGKESLSGPLIYLKYLEQTCHRAATP